MSFDFAHMCSIWTDHFCERTSVIYVRSESYSALFLYLLSVSFLVCVSSPFPPYIYQSILKSGPILFFVEIRWGSFESVILFCLLFIIYRRSPSEYALKTTSSYWIPPRLSYIRLSYRSCCFLCYLLLLLLLCPRLPDVNIINNNEFVSWEKVTK